jgi:selenocysteine-specific elongation factor
MVEDCGGRREDPSLFRLPIDRVFTMEGFGTVITGTLLEGSVSVGDEIEVYPSEKKAKVRSIQVHGKSVDRASAGQRTAINLTGIKKEEIQRGNVLAAKDSLETTMMLDVKIEMFADSPRTLLNDSRLHLYYGSAEALCKAVLLDAEALEAGQEGYAQLRLEEKIAVRRGDRFILRFYSPLESIGGGSILDANPPKRKRFRPEVIEALRRKDGQEERTVLEQVLREGSRKLSPRKALAAAMGQTVEETGKELDALQAEGLAIALDKDLLIHKDFLAEAEADALAILAAYRKENPVAMGMHKEEFRRRLLRKLRLEGEKSAELLLNRIMQGGRLTDSGNMISEAGAAAAEISPEHKAMRDRMERFVLERGVESPEEADILAAEKDKKTARQMLNRLLMEGTVVKLTPSTYIHKNTLDDAIARIRAHIAEHGSITLAEFRDAMGTSRKYAVLILDYLDQQKITRLEGDARILIG